MRRTEASDSAGCCRAVVAFTSFCSCDMPSLWAATSVNLAVTADSQQQQVVRICSCSSRRRESAHVCFCCGLPRRPPLPPWPGYAAHCCRFKTTLLSSWFCCPLICRMDRASNCRSPWRHAAARDIRVKDSSNDRQNGSTVMNCQGQHTSDMKLSTKKKRGSNMTRRVRLSRPMQWVKPPPLLR